MMTMFTRIPAHLAARLLTRRQWEIAACLAEGLTNEEIAERFGLEPGTVANHIVRLQRRLGLANRVQVAVWAARQDLQTLNGRA
jgi:DNA-binding NarL/FixJ family response regulator